MNNLILSLFPGADLLGRGFEAAGFCVVRGPDVLFGQDIRDFHPAPGHFVGVIGGPPCQDFSRARRRPPTGHGAAMLAEYARCVTEAGPEWWLMENVPGVPSLQVHGYAVQRFNAFASDFGVRQRRNRAFQFGSKDGIPLVLERTLSHFGKLRAAAMASDDRSLPDLCELQGLARCFTIPGLSREALKRAVGNGVPVPVARAIAEAIRARRLTEARLCVCGCGRRLTGAARQKAATAACRKRLERDRRITPAGSQPGSVTGGTGNQPNDHHEQRDAADDDELALRHSPNVPQGADDVTHGYSIGSHHAFFGAGGAAAVTAVCGDGAGGAGAGEVEAGGAVMRAAGLAGASAV